MPVFKHALEGTFTLADVDHIMAQVKGLPFSEDAVLEAADYDRYDWKARDQVRAARRFKGTITVSIEELPFPGIPRNPDAIEALEDHVAANAK